MNWTNSKILGALLPILFFLLSTQSTFAASESAQKTPSAKLVSLGSETRTDNRAKVLAEFLTQYDSPLAVNASDFVASADKHNLDWRFVAAISGVESTFGKQIPYNSYNAWGWGIYGDNMITFPSYAVAIETISEALRTRYMNKWGATDVYQIGKFYAASPTWAKRVVYFMEKMKAYELQSPENSLSITL